MFGLEANVGLPTREFTVSLFASMGLCHALLMNLLRSRPLFYKPMWMAYRTGWGLVAGLIVDHYAPNVKARWRSKVEFQKRLQEWEEGVLRRRELEQEALLARNKTL